MENTAASNTALERDIAPKLNISSLGQGRGIKRKEMARFYTPKEMTPGTIPTIPGCSTPVAAGNHIEKLTFKRIVDTANTRESEN